MQYHLYLPVERDSTHYVMNQYFFILMVLLLDCVVPHLLDASELANRTMMVLTLYLLLVTYKLAVSAELPVLPYNTALDRYMLFGFFFLTTHTLSFAVIPIGFDLQLQLFMCTLFFLVHAYLLREISRERKTKLKSIANAGSIDKNLMSLLDEAGIPISEDGYVVCFVFGLSTWHMALSCVLELDGHTHQLRYGCMDVDACIHSCMHACMHACMLRENADAHTLTRRVHCFFWIRFVGDLTQYNALLQSRKDLEEYDLASPLRVKPNSLPSRT